MALPRWLGNVRGDRVRCRIRQSIRRAGLAAALAAVTAGATVLTAGAAQAGVGTQPGDLELLSGGTPVTTGALTSTLTWATIGTPAGCPTGFQAAANVGEYTTGGTLLSLISPNVTSGLTAAFSGTFDGAVGPMLNFAGISATTPGTVEWVIGCYSGPGGTGNVVFVQSVFVSVAPGGTTFTASATAPTATTTTVTASPSPAPSGGSETLTASVTAADGTTPAGTVQFSANGTDIGTAVAVNTGGVATPATTLFTAPTTTISTTTVAVSAVFTPANTAGYAASTGTSSLLVEASGAKLGGAIPVDVAMPPTGSLTVTVSTAPISLAVTGTTSGSAPTFVGSQPGNVQLSPPTGALASTPTWSTTTACPAGFQGSAALFAFSPNPLGSPSGFAVSPLVTTVTSPFTGMWTAGQDVSSALGIFASTAPNSVTVLLAVVCYPAPNGGGGGEVVQSILVSAAAGSTSYTTSVPPPLTAPLTATGALNNVAVTDTRNTVPGWSISGQDTAFSGSGSESSIPGDDLGWSPEALGPSASASSSRDFVLGPGIAPGTSPAGLADAAAVLAYAPAGTGTGDNEFGANLYLDIPATAPPGPYTSTLTITYLDAGP